MEGRMAVHSQCGIVSGPSKWDLMLSLFESSTTGRRRLVFTVASRRIKEDVEERRALINSIERVDDSGENWLVGGRIEPMAGSCQLPMMRFKASFSTQTRKGHLTLMT